MALRRYGVPFVVALALASVAIWTTSPFIGEFGDIGLVTLAGAPIGLVTALASRRWGGVLAMLLAFGIAGAPVGVMAVQTPGDVLKYAIGAAGLYALAMGILGLPVYLVTVAVIRLAARRVDSHEGPRPGLG